MLNAAVIFKSYQKKNLTNSNETGSINPGGLAKLTMQV
jgi:hypothetical protein